MTCLLSYHKKNIASSQCQLHLSSWPPTYNKSTYITVYSKKYKYLRYNDILWYPWRYFFLWNIHRQMLNWCMTIERPRLGAVHVKYLCYTSQRTDRCQRLSCTWFPSGTPGCCSFCGKEGVDQDNGSLERLWSPYDHPIEQAAQLNFHWPCTFEGLHKAEEESWYQRYLE